MNDIEKYIKGTNSILAKSASAHEAYAPIVVDKLIALGLVKSSSRGAAISSLNSPELVFSTLNSLLDSSLASQTRAPVASLGSAVKSASSAVEGKVKKESDKNFEAYFLNNRS